MTRRATVKVRTSNEDGRTYAELWTPGHAKVGLAYVNVREDEWHAFQLHCTMDRMWQERLRLLDAEQYEKEHPSK